MGEAGELRLNPSHEEQHDENDQDDADEADAAVTVAVAVAAKAAAEPTEQEDNEDDDEDDAERHGAVLPWVAVSVIVIVGCFGARGNKAHAWVRDHLSVTVWPARLRKTALCARILPIYR